MNQTSRPLGWCWGVKGSSLLIPRLRRADQPSLIERSLLSPRSERLWLFPLSSVRQQKRKELWMFLKRRFVWETSLFVSNQDLTICSSDNRLNVRFITFKQANDSNVSLLGESTSFTPSVSFPVSVLFSVFFPVPLLLGGGVDAVLTSVLLPLLVPATELFTDPSGVWGSFGASHTILPANQEHKKTLRYV